VSKAVPDAGSTSSRLSESAHGRCSPSEWSPWGACTASECGREGRQFRTSHCYEDGCEDKIESRVCHAPSCRASITVTEEDVLRLRASKPTAEPEEPHVRTNAVPLHVPDYKAPTDLAGKMMNASPNPNPLLIFDFFLGQFPAASTFAATAATA